MVDRRCWCSLSVGQHTEVSVTPHRWCSTRYLHGNKKKLQLGPLPLKTESRHEANFVIIDGTAGWRHAFHPWASYQIRRIAGCACAGNAGNVFSCHRFQRKPLVSDPGMHHGTCVTHVPWCMPGSLTCGDGKNVPGIPGACAPAILRIWQEAHALTSTVLYLTTEPPPLKFGGSVNSTLKFGHWWVITHHRKQWLQLSLHVLI